MLNYFLNKNNTFGAEIAQRSGMYTWHARDSSLFPNSTGPPIFDQVWLWCFPSTNNARPEYNTISLTQLSIAISKPLEHRACVESPISRN